MANFTFEGKPKAAGGTYNQNLGKADTGSLLPYGARKESPNSLIEELEGSQIPAGASLMVLSNDGKNKIEFITNNFYLSGMRMAYKEKTQITETFNSAAVSFFGDSVKVYSIAGKMLDFPSYPRGAEDNKLNSDTMAASAFNIFYREELRASRLFQKKQIALLKVYNHWIWGYPLNFELSYNAGEDKVASFGMSFLVSKHEFGMEPFFSEKDLRDSMRAGSFYTKALSAQEKELVRLKTELLNIVTAYSAIPNEVQKHITNYFQPKSSYSESDVVAFEQNKLITSAPAVSFEKQVWGLSNPNITKVTINNFKASKLNKTLKDMAAVLSQSELAPSYFISDIANLIERTESLRNNIDRWRAVYNLDPTLYSELVTDKGEVAIMRIYIDLTQDTALLKDINLEDVIRAAEQKIATIGFWAQTRN